MSHNLDKITKWHFKSTSNEVICPQKVSNFIHRYKSAILAILKNGLGWPCPVRLALKNPSQELKKYVCLGCADEYIERLDGKIETVLMSNNCNCESNIYDFNSVDLNPNWHEL